jgi:DnaK suppressor protein
MAFENPPAATNSVLREMRLELKIVRPFPLDRPWMRPFYPPIKESSIVTGHGFPAPDGNLVRTFGGFTCVIYAKRTNMPSVDYDRCKEVLQNKERELEGEVVRLREEGRDSRSAEVEDPIDYVTSSQGQAAAFEASTRLSDTLAAVRDALQRLDNGSYGICIDCGRPVEEARLEAVPWTPYCKADQEKHDAAETRAAAADIS